MKLTDTRELLLDVAQEFAQSRGYNSFSYKDLEVKVGIKTASIHYHFPSKSDLGEALMRRYRENFAKKCAQLDKEFGNPAERLQAYIKFLQSSLKKGSKRCLCGVFAGELSTLPGSIQQEVKLTFEYCESWLSKLFVEGKKSGDFLFSEPSQDLAETIFSGLQGAMIAACAFEDEKRFVRIANSLVKKLG